MPEKPDQRSGTPTSHVQGLDKAGSPPASHPLQPTRYLAWLYSPPLQRPVLAALCEIESEIATSLRAGLDHHVAHTRLQWWREECERCAQARPVHPLTRELVKAYGALTVNPHSGGATSPAPSPLAGIMGFADTAVWDLAGATFETRRELTAYCERWAAAMIEPIAAHAAATGASALGATESVPAAETAPTAAGAPDKSRWRALGAALREVELLANLAPEAHSGRLRVPLDELERAGVDPASLARPPWPAALTTLLRERHEALRAAIMENVSGPEPDEQANFRGLLVWAALAWQLSRRAQRVLPNAIASRRYHALADGWHAWRAARHAVTGNFRLS
jgi:phytoene synthase